MKSTFLLSHLEGCAGLDSKSAHPFLTAPVFNYAGPLHYPSGMRLACSACTGKVRSADRKSYFSFSSLWTHCRVENSTFNLLLTFQFPPTLPVSIASHIIPTMYQVQSHVTRWQQMHMLHECCQGRFIPCFFVHLVYRKYL